MAIQQLATLWTPDRWFPAIAERQATFPYLFNSKAVKRTDRLTELVSGAGTIANMPFLKDITDQANEVQVEHTAPTTINGAPGDVVKYPILNRVTKNSWTAMSANVSGADIMPYVWGSMAERRLKQDQTTLINYLRGVFGTGGAANAAAQLSDVRFGGTTAEPFIENPGSDPANQYLISVNMIIRTKALLAELEDTLKSGCMFVHPDIKASLEILDAISFRTTEPGVQSGLPFAITTYRGIPLFVSSALRRAGTGNGYVYDSYLIAEGSLGFGEKPQLGDQPDLASLSYFYDRDLNDYLIWDRNRIAFSVDGVSFTGTPSASSATDAELATPGNYSLKYQSANRCGAAALRTNG